MVSTDPFQSTIFSADPRVAPLCDARIYGGERARLAEAIASSASLEPGHLGRIQLIRGREAGSGKSHLIAAALSEVTGRNHVLPLVFNRETPPTWVELFKQSLTLLAQRPSETTASALSLAARQLFAELVGELIASGHVPTKDPAGARRGIEANSAELFDLRCGSPIAGWFVDNADEMLEPLAGELQRRTRMGLGECRDWLSFLIAFESGCGEVAVPESFAASEGLAKEHLRHLGQLVARHRPLLLVFDQLDTLHGDLDAALTMACMVCESARIGVAPLILVALNDDVWNKAFAPALPMALADRLTEGCIELRGIGREEADALIRARLQSAAIDTADARRFREALQLDQVFESRAGARIQPRELLRIASATWRDGAPPEIAARRSGALAIDHPGAAPARETLGRVQAMLREFNRRRPAADGAAAEAPSEPEPAAPDKSPWPAPAADAPHAVREFASQREAIYFGSDLVFDPSAIRHTLELAGRRSPLIDYREFHVAGGTDAACWRSPDHEILFGFEPADRKPYWRALVEQAGESPLGRSKVVAFTPPGTPAFETDGLNGHAGDRLDVLELDRCALATIAATDRVVRSSDDEEATFALLAPELDSLWRRITRPMGA